MEQYLGHLGASEGRQLLLSLSLLDQIEPQCLTALPSASAQQRSQGLGSTQRVSSCQKKPEQQLCLINSNGQSSPGAMEGGDSKYQPASPLSWPYQLSQQQPLRPSMGESEVHAMTPASRKSERKSLHHQELTLLRELKEEAILNMNAMENAQQAKENFHHLFQKVYGIISEIEQRSEKVMLSNSKLSNPRRQFQIASQVIEVSLQAPRAQPSEFRNASVTVGQDAAGWQHDLTLQQSQSAQVFRDLPKNLHSDQSAAGVCSRGRQIQLSRECSRIRSDRSRSKGITITSASKDKNKFDGKKAIKVTLVQKNQPIPASPRVPSENAYMSVKQKVQGKTSASINPASYFSSKRISSRA